MRVRCVLCLLRDLSAFSFLPGGGTRLQGEGEEDDEEEEYEYGDSGNSPPVGNAMQAQGGDSDSSDEVENLEAFHFPGLCSLLHSPSVV